MHAARRLHFDLRLELDGVLKSWAVTRGPSLTLGEKRLAVRTEDHPVDYLDFEGNIPKGEYGGGSMIVWDRGRWLPQGDPQFGLQKGHLAFVLEGTRLQGLWHLVRIRPRKGEKTEPWLLMKAEDEFARHPGEPEITEELTTSYLSGRTNQELAAAGDIRVDHAARGKIAKARQRLLPDPGKVAGARKKLLPAFLEPSLASPCEKPPSGPKWIHEIKHNGYRLQARIDGASVQLLTRKGLDWTQRFSSLAAAVKKIGLASGLLDGEVVVEDQSGITSFNNLQSDLSAGRQDRFRYFVFDLLYCEGFDLTKAVLIDRKNLLQQILAGLPAGAPVRFSEHLEVDGPTMLEHSCRFGLEGIISKRKDQPYRSGRGEHWLKSKCIDRQEFVLLGYIPSSADSRSVGALALGYYAGGALTYAGGSGPAGPPPRPARCAMRSRRSLPRNRSSPTSCRPAPRRACAGSRRGWSARSSFAAGPRTGCCGRPRSRDCARTRRPTRSCWRARQQPPSRRAGARSRRCGSPIRSAFSGRSLASPSKASPSSMPRSPTGFCRM